MSQLLNFRVASLEVTEDPGHCRPWSQRHEPSRCAGTFKTGLSAVTSFKASAICFRQGVVKSWPLAYLPTTSAMRSWMKPCKECCAMFLRRYSPCLQHGVRALCRPSFGHATGRRVASRDVLLLMVVVVKLSSELAPLSNLGKVGLRVHLVPRRL